MKNPVERVIDILGGAAALAREMRIKPQSVAEWKVKGIIPPNRVLRVAKLVKNKVRAHELNPHSHGIV